MCVCVLFGLKKDFDNRKELEAIFGVSLFFLHVFFSHVFFVSRDVK